MTDERAELEAAIERVRGGVRAGARRDALQTQIQREDATLAQLQATVQESEHRVENLEGRSLEHVVAALRRRQDEDIDAARDAVRATQLELTTRRRALQQLCDERDAAKARAGELEADKRALADAESRLEAERSAGGGPQAEKLRALAGRKSQLASDLSECDELAAAANSAAGALAACRDKLHSAGDWATYDTFFNGGLIAASMEYHRVDEAAQTVGDAQAALQRLAAEVQSLRDPQALLPDIGADLKTANIWFDNIFSDWMVRSRINASEESVRATETSVAQLVAKLTERRTALTAELEQVDAELESVLLGA